MPRQANERQQADEPLFFVQISMLRFELSHPRAELTDNLRRREPASIAPAREFCRGLPRLLEHAEPISLGLRHAASLARCAFSRKRIEKRPENRDI
jgi:hypothetical protein